MREDDIAERLEEMAKWGRQLDAEDGEGGQVIVCRGNCDMACPCPMCFVLEPSDYELPDELKQAQDAQGEQE